MVNLNPIYYYRSLPKSTKRFLYIFALPLQIAYNYWQAMQFNVYILSGKGKNSDTTIKTLYISSCEIVPYFIERIYETVPESNFLKKAYLWQLGRIITRESQNTDLTLIDIHKFARCFFKLKNAFLVPKFIRQTLDINKPIEKIVETFRSDAKDTLRKILKFDYSYDVFSDLDSLKLFYEKMHVPYIKKRYQAQASINDFGELKEILKKGELLFIKTNGEYIAGGLRENKKECYFCRRKGILDGNEDFLKMGAFAALYYFSILRAKEKNMKTIDFGLSRPFLSDGVLRNKRRWGAQVCQDRNIKGSFYFKVNKPNNMATVFTEQPFICIDKGKLKGVIFLNGDTKTQNPDINSLIEKFSTPGITSFKVMESEEEKEYPVLE